MRDSDAHRLAGVPVRGQGRAARFVVGPWVAVPADGWFGEETAQMPVPVSTSASGTPVRGVKRASSTGRTAVRTSRPQRVRVRPVGCIPALITASMAHRESKRCAKFFVTQCVRSAMTCRNFAWSNSELASKRTGTASNMTTCIGLTSGPRPLQIICVERTTDANVRAQSPGHEPDRPARAVCA